MERASHESLAAGALGLDSRARRDGRATSSPKESRWCRRLPDSADAAAGRLATPSGVPGVIRGLLLAQWSGAAPVPSLRKSAALAVLVVLAGLSILRFDLTRGGPFHPFDNGHAILSLRMAFNWSQCGVYSRLSSEHDTALTAALRAPQDPDRPILATVIDAAGSLEEYCATLTLPFQNNENGIMILAAGYMALDPEISMRGLATAWVWQTVPLLLFFCVALIATGQGLLSPFWFSGS